MTTADRRKRASHHVVPDYVNLISALREIERGHAPPVNSHVFYAFVLQHRKFATFFSNKKQRRAIRRKSSDLLAKDFVSRKIRFDLPEWRKWEDHMNAHLFHLGTGRTRNSRPWIGTVEIPRMARDFRAAWRLFIENLPGPLKAEFKEEIVRKCAPESEFADLDVYSG